MKPMIGDTEEQDDEDDEFDPVAGHSMTSSPSAAGSSGPAATGGGNSPDEGVLGGDVDDRHTRDADEDEGELVPVEEWHAEKAWFVLVVPGA